MLHLKSVGAGYGRVRILRDVTFSVKTGDIVAIIGRNGVGKSTLMKTVIGLITTSAGSIIFDDDDITHASATLRARRGIGYVPQGRGMFPELTVLENLRIGTKIGGGLEPPSYDLVYEYFPVLKSRAQQKAGTLSGGEQQMLAIGRALVGKPKLLLLDEPSEGIQPSIVHQIGTNLVEVAARIGLTILFVEQNVDLITLLARRCYVMDKGTVVDSVEPAALHEQETVRRFLAV